MKNRTQTDTIVVHCSATPASMDIGAELIREWHLARDWDDIGYAAVIRRDGRIEFGRPFNAIGAHVAGHNGHTVGVCLIGGLDANMQPEDNFTAEQFISLRLLIQMLMKAYPGSTVMGHRDFPAVNKDCPCFDAGAWWSQMESA